MWKKKNYLLSGWVALKKWLLSDEYDRMDEWLSWHERRNEEKWYKRQEHLERKYGAIQLQNEHLKKLLIDMQMVQTHPAMIVRRDGSSKLTSKDIPITEDANVF